MNNTENKFKFEGAWYESADPEVKDGCTGCKGKYDDHFCANAPLCVGVDRKDNRNVIFVESDADNQGGEE